MMLDYDDMIQDETGREVSPLDDDYEYYRNIRCSPLDDDYNRYEKE